MPLTEQAMERFKKALRLTTPIITLYDAPPDESFAPLVEAKGRACSFCYYPNWLRGETLVVRQAEGGSFMNPTNGCPGLQSHLGFQKKYPPWMANFLTDGKNGAPMGEGLKASPELAQEWLEKINYPQPSGETILLGPLRLAHWEKARTITIFADPDRLSALMTLSAYWSSDPDEVQAAFSSGCGMLWEVFHSHQKDRPVIGCTDIAMRKYIPPEIMCLTVTRRRFEQMVNFPDDAFLMKTWWNDLMDSREKGKSS